MNIVNVDPTKRLLMDRLLAEARGFGLRLAEVNVIKPWGAYLRFTQDSLGHFLSAYWLDVKMELPPGGASVEPKVLLVAPGKVLSLQWHERRDELWRVIDGPVRVVTGGDWNSLQVCDYETGEVIDIPQGQWHRLIGLANWGRVAEIWQHTDPQHFSEEQDILRVQDYYGRVDAEADRTAPVDQRDAVWATVYPQICAQAGLAP